MIAYFNEEIDKFVGELSFQVANHFEKEKVSEINLVIAS